ncbi:hypothetical protein KCU98_g195, partial [Aureobasidium melanogenum]
MSGEATVLHGQVVVLLLVHLFVDNVLLSYAKRSSCASLVNLRSATSRLDSGLETTITAARSSDNDRQRLPNVFLDQRSIRILDAAKLFGIGGLFDLVRFAPIVEFPAPGLDHNGPPVDSSHRPREPVQKLRLRCTCQFDTPKSHQFTHACVVLEEGLAPLKSGTYLWTFRGNN